MKEKDNNIRIESITELYSGSMKTLKIIKNFTFVADVTAAITYYTSMKMK